MALSSDEQIRVWAEDIGNDPVDRVAPFAPKVNGRKSMISRPPSFPRTDAGNGEMFADRTKGLALHDHSSKTWFLWGANAWVPDRDGAMHRLAKEALRSRVQAAAALPDDERKREIKWALQSESRRGLDAMLALAESEQPLAITGDEWNRHPMLYPVQNGVVDLETGQLRDGRPEDMVNRVSPIAFDPKAQCPRWSRAVQEIFAAHPDVADYLQRVIGYSLTGQTTEQALWILFGSGANGKSTLIETLVRLFGADLAWTMPFPSTTWSDSASEYQKAALAGRRFVTSSEVAKQGRLNEELIKSLTGGDTINARHPYGRPFQFIPTAKFFLRVNDKPQIRDESHGMWRRIKLVPFTQTFPIDTTLSDTLAAELPGILQWALRGCLDWQRDGLREPAAVRAATDEYRHEQDQLAQFIAARCVEQEGVSVRAGALFAAYKSWSDQNVRLEERLNQTTFGKRVKAKYTHNDAGRHTVYFGLVLADDEGES